MGIQPVFTVLDPSLFMQHFEILIAPTSSRDNLTRINFMFRRRSPSHLACLLDVLTHSMYKAKLALTHFLFQHEKKMQMPLAI